MKDGFSKLLKPLRRILKRLLERRKSANTKVKTQKALEALGWVQWASAETKLSYKNLK